MTDLHTFLLWMILANIYFMAARDERGVFSLLGGLVCLACAVTGLLKHFL